MPDIVVPNGGTTDDQTPEVRIMLNGPLWPGSEVRVRRNGVDVGVATQLSSTEFVFVDNVTDGSFEYRAVVSRQNVSKQSAPYFVQVSTPVQVNAPTGKLDVSFNNVFPAETPQTKISQVVTNNTEATKQFDLFGLRNNALDGTQPYVLNVATAMFSPNSMLTLDVELYRRVNGEFVLQNTLDASTKDFALLLSEFLLDGATPAADRFARFSLLAGGTFSLVSNVEGDYWSGELNGSWTGKVNSDIETTLVVDNNLGSDMAIYRSLSTAETHDNPLSEDYGGVWSWRDDSGALMVFDTDKFVTGLSGSNWSNSGPQFVMALDGMFMKRRKVIRTVRLQ
jgi:hypothetical protein